MSKDQDKHNKYNEFYNNIKNDTVYWGLGIENESYLMFKKPLSTTRDLMLKNHKPERYSVNYYRNYNHDILYKTLLNLPDVMQLPIYINGYLFQNADVNGEHKTLYSKESYINEKFNGITIHEYMISKSQIYKKLFEKNMIFDGDTFEFTTFNFYKTNVLTVISELNKIKSDFLKEINDKLVGKGIFKDSIIYPPINYGFVRFNSNINNLGICNSGTYHINITLPTMLDVNGDIMYPERFKNIHMNAIRAIQWIEPVLVCIYGTPDILSQYNNDYSKGSLRLMLSRYIGMGTYDTKTAIKGKLLNCAEQPYYFKDLHNNSPYFPPETIGYDINYNKFQKHGIELRIFDYFPETHLEDVINFLLLVCTHSTTTKINEPLNDIIWDSAAIEAIKNGRTAHISKYYIETLYNIFKVKQEKEKHKLFCYKPKYINKTMIEHINYIANKLRKRYLKSYIIKNMSPNMKQINLMVPEIIKETLL
jgi:hypothetical protein